MKVIVKDGVLPIALLSTNNTEVDLKPMLDKLQKFVEYASNKRDFDNAIEVALDMQGWMSETYKLYPEDLKIQTTIGAFVEEDDGTICVYSYDESKTLDKETLIDIGIVEYLRERAAALRALMDEQPSQASKES